MGFVKNWILNQLAQRWIKTRRASHVKVTSSWLGQSSLSYSASSKEVLSPGDTYKTERKWGKQIPLLTEIATKIF